MRSKRYWLYFLSAVVVCVGLTSAVEAQCAKCLMPPGQTTPSCGNTYYNGANACVISPTECSYLGSCEGLLGDECPAGPGLCPVDRWACGRPLGEEWRLDAWTVDVPAPPVQTVGTDKA